MTERGDNPKHMFLSLFLNLLVEGVSKTPGINAKNRKHEEKR